MQTLDYPVAYVRVDRYDNDQTQFWLHVLNALNRAVEVEDLHEISDAEVWQSIGAPGDDAPQGLTIAVTSRTEPPLGLAQRRVSGELVEIRLQDLAFDGVAAAQILSGLVGQPLASDTPVLLNELVEGWGAGLSLAALVLRSGVDESDLVSRFAGGDRNVGEYLCETVLSAADKDDLEFMLQTAVLRELDAQLCDAVRNSDDSGQRLSDVATQNLFLIPCDVRRTYRYRGVIRDWLEVESSKSGWSIAEASRRACSVYVERGDAFRAMDYVFESGDVDLAHSLFKQFALEAIAAGNRTTVAEWCQRFPDDVSIEISTRLNLTQAWEAIFGGTLTCRNDAATPLRGTPGNFRNQKH